MFDNTNPYTLRTETVEGITRYFVSFTDGQANPQETELSYPVYAELRRAIKRDTTDDATDDALIARFTAFMVKVVSNAKIEYIRRQRHWKWEIPMDHLPMQEESPFTSERWQNGASENEFDFAEERISNAFSSLPALRRRILELSFIESLPAQEIADELGCSIKYVYDQKHIALKKLRDILMKGAN